MTCVGQIIGAVLAETQSQAQRAAKMVKVTYEELPRILTIEVNDFLLGFSKVQFLATVIRGGSLRNETVTNQ